MLFSSVGGTPHAPIIFLSTADTDVLTLRRALAVSARAADGARPAVWAGNPSAPGVVQRASQALESTAPGAATVVLRLHGGMAAAAPAVAALVALCRRREVPLILLSGDGRPDAKLSALNTAPAEVVGRVSRYLEYGGVANFVSLLRALGDRPLSAGGGELEPAIQPAHGVYHPDLAPDGHPYDQPLGEAVLLERFDRRQRPVVGLLFYRAHWLSGNLAFVDALVRALERHGCDTLPVFCQSLRPPSRSSSEDYVLERYFLHAKPGIRTSQVAWQRKRALPGLGQGKQAKDGGDPAALQRSRIDVLISTLSFAAGTVGTPSRGGREQGTEAGGDAGAWLARLGVPVLQALIATDGRAAWAQRSTGMRPLDVAMQVALPEFDGRVITVPVAYKAEASSASGEMAPLAGEAGVIGARETDVVVGRCSLPPVAQGGGVGASPTRKKSLFEASPIGLNEETVGALYVPDEERCSALAAQAAAWARLRRTPPALRRVAVVLGNSPPTNGRLGNAVGLDTPASLRQLLLALRDAGYAVGEIPHSGDALMRRLIDAGTYDATAGDFPVAPAEWDEWRGPPGLRCGSVFIAAQPPRGWGDDPTAIYHDPELPPPPIYSAFYRWLRAAPPAGFGAHAVVHLGKHGTLEWLPGKAVGLSAECAPDALLGDLPLVYPFAVNDPGEGAQAKRRTHAVLVGHMVPPLAPAGRYGELALLERLIQEERAARVLDPAKLPLLREQIWEAVRRAALDDDLELQSPDLLKRDDQPPDAPRPELRTAGDQPPDVPRRDHQRSFDVFLARLEGYLDELQRATIRDGLHVLGQAPTGTAREHLLDALLRLAPEAEQGADSPLRAEVGGRLDRTLEEMDAVLGALGGGYVPAGPSGSPSRGMWNVLPTGRNFYSVDPQAIPSPAAWQTGRRLATALLERHLKDTGRYPQTVGLVVWGTATMRTHGDDVAQALALLGVRPLWQPQTGRVTAVEPVLLAELGRPRIDVTLHISGMFRDAFPHLVALLDGAVQIVASLDEPAPDNFVAAHVRAEADRLREHGMDAPAATRRASLRLFGSKPGCYGAGLLPLIEQRNWRSPADLAQAYESWSSYAYGQDVPGRAERGAFRARFAAIDVAVKNQDNREHDLFDSDDYFQYHGGMVATAQALRSAAPDTDDTVPDGDPRSPVLRAYFGDSADPDRPMVRSLAEEARRVFRSRAINPQWIAAMRRHGYKGAMELAATVDYLFGYDATTGVVADWMYQGLAESYVFDLQQQDFFHHSNPWALRDITARLLEAASRGMWQEPAPHTLQRLRQVYLGVEGDLEAGSSASASLDAGAVATGAAPLVTARGVAEGRR